MCAVIDVLNVVTLRFLICGGHEPFASVYRQSQNLAYLLVFGLPVVRVDFGLSSHRSLISLGDRFD